MKRERAGTCWLEPFRYYVLLLLLLIFGAIWFVLAVANGLVFDGILARGPFRLLRGIFLGYQTYQTRNGTNILHGTLTLWTTILKRCRWDRCFRHFWFDNICCFS